MRGRREESRRDSGTLVPLGLHSEEQMIDRGGDEDGEQSVAREEGKHGDNGCVKGILRASSSFI